MAMKKLKYFNTIIKPAYTVDFQNFYEIRKSISFMTSSVMINGSRLIQMKLNKLVISNNVSQIQWFVFLFGSKSDRNTGYLLYTQHRKVEKIVY